MSLRCLIDPRRPDAAFPQVRVRSLSKAGRMTTHIRLIVGMRPPSCEQFGLPLPVELDHCPLVGLVQLSSARDAWLAKGCEITGASAGLMQPVS